MRKIVAIMALCGMVLVGCGSADTGSNSSQDDGVVTLFDKALDVTDSSISNADGTFTVPEVTINGMKCIIIEFSTDDVRNGITIDCDWRTKKD